MGVITTRGPPPPLPAMIMITDSMVFFRSLPLALAIALEEKSGDCKLQLHEKFQSPKAPTPALVTYIGAKKAPIPALGEQSELKSSSSNSDFY